MLEHDFTKDQARAINELAEFYPAGAGYRAGIPDHVRKAVAPLIEMGAVLTESAEGVEYLRLSDGLAEELRNAAAEKAAAAHLN